MSEAAPRKLISIIIPVFNEEDNVVPAYKAVCEVMRKLRDRYDFEIIFTDNRSEDRTFAELETLAKQDSRVRVVRFARNFGFNRSVLTGFRLASGEAAIQIDCDLQDPPSMFLEFIEKWEQGHDVVVGVRRTRQEWPLLTAARRAFYRTLERLSEDNLLVDGGDFRLVDRRILDLLCWIDDAAPYTRGLTSQLAARQIGISYDRNVRRAGTSKFPIRRLIGLAAEGVLAHSIAPLRLSTLMGIVIAGITVIFALSFSLLRLLGNDWPSGFTMITVLILLSISLNAIFLGIIGEYIGRIYIQLRRRPTTVIESALNLPPQLLRASTGSRILPPD